MPFGKILAVFFISTGDAARSASVKFLKRNPIFDTGRNRKTSCETKATEGRNIDHRIIYLSA
jgi:hypothetical protein